MNIMMFRMIEFGVKLRIIGGLTIIMRKELCGRNRPDTVSAAKFEQKIHEHFVRITQ